MITVLEMILSVFILALGFPLGNFLASKTKDESKEGQFWFKVIILFSGVGAILSLIFKSDILLFTFLFIAIVTSRSLKR